MIVGWITILRDCCTGAACSSWWPALGSQGLG
jgi:hypothetical protein